MGFPGPSRACLQRWCVVLVVLELVDQSKEVPGRESILLPSTLEETVPLIFRDLRWKVGDTAKLQGHRGTARATNRAGRARMAAPRFRGQGEVGGGGDVFGIRTNSQMPGRSRRTNQPSAEE